MSHLKNLIGGMGQMLEEKELSEVPGPKKYPVTVRIDCMQMQYFAMLAEMLDTKRSPLIVALASSALLDAMDELGVTDEFYGKLKSQEAFEKDGK